MSVIYQNANDLFIGARDAKREIEITLHQLKSISSRRFSLGTILKDSNVSSSVQDVNKTDKSIHYLDFQAIARDRMSRDKETIQFALEVLYGTKSSGGVAALIGAIPADIIRMRYVEDLTWEALQRQCPVSRNTACAYIQEAFNLIDAYGFDRVRLGLGFAESL